MVKNKIDFVLKEDLVKFALDKNFITKKSVTKGFIIDKICSNLNDDLAEEIIKKFSNKIGFTANEVEEILNCTKEERKRWTKKEHLNVTGYYEVRAYGKYIDCPIYDAIQVLNLTEDELQNWRSKKRKLSNKQLEGLEKGRQKMLENRTCKECGSIKSHKKELEDGLCSRCIQELEHQEWAKEQEESAKNNFKRWYLNKEDYLILDTETTGMGYCDEIIEISIIDLSGNVLLDTLIKSTVPISSGAYEVHGISDGLLKDKPTWDEVYPKVKDIINDKTLLIYNDEFDMRMLKQTCKAFNIEFKEVKHECIMKNYAKIHSYYSDYYEDFIWVKLEDAAMAYQNHRALGDCLLCLKLIENENEESEKI